MTAASAFRISALLACWIVAIPAFAQERDSGPQDPGDADSASPDSGTADSASPDSGQEPPPSVPPGVETPLTLAEEGADLHRRGEYEAAQAKLEEAYTEVPLPTIGVWLARNLDRLGRMLDAQERYRALVEEEDRTTQSALAAAQSKGLAPPGLDDQKKAKESAELELEQLVERIPTMVVVVSGDDGQAEVSLDSGAAPLGEARQFDPGPYRVEGRLDDQIIVRAVVLHQRDRATVGLPFRAGPAPAPDGTAQSVVGWVLVGIGGVATVTGGVLAGIAAARLGDLDCPDNRCQPSQRDDMGAYNDLRLPSGFLLVGGGLLAATGVAVVLNAPADHEQEASVSAVIGPGMVGLRGAF